MTPNFLYAVEKVLLHEGGYVDDPVDPGGETNFGISKRAFPNEDIANMTRKRAIEIYHQKYWDKVHLDMVADKLLAADIFDMGVNAGPRTGVELAQVAANMLNNYVRDKTLVEDGILGPKTAAALNKMSLSRDGNVLLQVYKALRIGYYEKLMDANKSLRKYSKGWLRRAVG